IRSYESIIEPRINWLLDLDLIDSIYHKQGFLKLSSAGNIFLNSVEGIFNSEEFIENFYIETFSKTYSLNPIMGSNICKKIDKYLNFAFLNFKTLSPNRITASQAFTYISWMLLLREGFVAEYNDIKNYIFANDGKGYTIDWFPSENDGSLKKIT